MSEKLSERLDRLAGLTVESPAPHLTGDMKFYVYDVETREAMTEAAAALRAVEGVCVWTIDDIDESWDGSCGAKWQFSDGGPIENDMRHCPQCGKTIALVPLDAAGSAEGVS